MVVFGIVVSRVWHTEFPVWAFFLSLMVGMSSLAVDGMLVLIIFLNLAFVNVIPIGMIQAITNQQITTM